MKNIGIKLNIFVHWLVSEGSEDNLMEKEMIKQEKF